MAVAVGFVYALRPGVVENGVGSPRVWLVALAVLAVGQGLRLLVTRATRRPRLASAASSMFVIAVASALLVPSFRQRSLEEPFPLVAAGAAKLAQSSALPLPSSAASSTALPRTQSTGPTAEGRQPAAATNVGAPPPRPAAPPQPAPPPEQPPAVTAGAPAAAQQQQSPAATTPAAAAPKRLSAGRLDGIGHDASGQTALYDVEGRTVLRFEDVNIEGTPGPYIYLVRRGSRTPEGGLLVGALKAERGSFGYTLPESFDPGADWTVLVWCRPYDTPIAASDQ